MATLFDYLYWRGDLPFSVSAFGAVDGVILARLAYVPFERILTFDTDAQISVQQAAEALLAQPGIDEAVRRPDDVTLLRALAGSARFRTLLLSNYVNKLDAKTQTQFSAVTLAFPDGTALVSFRGTDSTLIGWKEDFNMSFVCPVPAQELAVSYLERAAAAYPDAPLLVAGHSKGGNLAVYAAAFCQQPVQARIRAVYNYDGPGFEAKTLAQPGYQRVCARVQTFVPQSSVVGMLLGHEEAYTIVHSTQSGLTQHDVYSWEVRPDGFVCLETVTNSSRFLDATLKSWLAAMDTSQREAFVDAVYDIMVQTNAHTLHEMGENWLQSAGSILHSIKNLDDDTRHAVTHALTLLVRSAGSGLSQFRSAT